MSLLDRYIGQTLLGTVIAVMLVILFLNGLFAFIDELNNTQGQYQAAQVFTYILYTLPRRLVDYTAMTTMIGCLVGMGMLANHSELTVMRAAGVSKWRILLSVIKPVVVLVVVVMLLAEFVAPRMDQAAEAYKTEKTEQALNLGKGKGMWHRDGDVYLHINAVRPDGVLLGVTYYEFNEDRELLQAGYAKQAVYQDDQWWQQDVRLTRFYPMHTEVSEAPRLAWDVSLDPNLLLLLADDPNNMSMLGLYKYSQYLQQQAIDAIPYQLAFWQKLLLPIAVIALVLIAMSTLFGTLRSVTMGQRIMVGFMAGMLFKIVQDILGPATSVYGWSPLISALAPVLLCLFAGGWMLKKAG